MKRKFTANARLINELFTRYLNTYYAFCELLNNSIQAQSDNIYIDIEYSKEDEVTDTLIKKIVIRDDGIGVHINELEDRILNIGTTNKKGGKGIGRFAALQIGKIIDIETIGYDSDDNTYSSTLSPLRHSRFKHSENIDQIEIETIEDVLDGKKHNTYYQITIKDLYNSADGSSHTRNRITQKFLQENLPSAIFESYPLLIFNKEVNFYINGKYLDPNDYVKGSPENKKLKYSDKKGKDHEIIFRAINVKSKLDKRKIFITTTNAGIETIVTGFEFDAKWLSPKIGDWFIYLKVDSLPVDLFRNIDLGDLDEGVKHFKTYLKNTINSFFREKNKDYEDFTKKLKSDKYYPYKEAKSPDYNAAKVLVFDKLAFIVEEKYQVLKNNQKLREIIYPLMDRTISNGDFEDILKTILKLNDDFISRFRSIIKSTDLDDLISFNERVLHKLETLEFLQKIIYSDVSKHIKERSELHKFLEKMLWVFGERYNDSTNLLSDKNLANNLEALRNEILTTEISKRKYDNVIDDIKGKSKSITDLFLYSEKIIDENKKEILVVELKAPRVKISPKEIEQVEKYAYEIEQRGMFSDQLKYTVLLISSDLNDRAKSKFAGNNKGNDNPYLFWTNERGNIEIWIIKWSDLFENLRRKLNYMSANLKVKDKSILEKIEEEFSSLELTKLTSRLRKVAV